MRLRIFYLQKFKYVLAVAYRFSSEFLESSVTAAFCMRTIVAPFRGPCFMLVATYWKKKCWNLCNGMSNLLNQIVALET